MKALYIKIIVAVNLVIVLVLFHSQINSKEAVVSEGKLVYLPLAPRDPRSLMQGDYMALNYEIIQDSWLWRDSMMSPRGYAVIYVNDSSVVSLIRLQAEKLPLNKSESLIKYFPHGSGISLGAESYFFEEGTGEAYSLARFGGVRLDEEGNSVLIGLYDSEFKKLTAADTTRARLEREARQAEWDSIWRR